MDSLQARACACGGPSSQGKKTASVRSQASAFRACACVDPSREKPAASVRSQASAFRACAFGGVRAVGLATLWSMAVTANEAYASLACASPPACYSCRASLWGACFVLPASSCAALLFFSVSPLVLAWACSWPTCCGLRVAQKRFDQSRMTGLPLQTKLSTCTVKISYS